ncbi:hypothetical protein AB0A63_37820 [Lentzea sp. NPDC042327]|uniref:hypothetical protein n=1 Tax=Lentzea sp. NPDC042327 TaxID=3154801 RepID=UPI0033C38FF2
MREKLTWLVVPVPLLLVLMGAVFAWGNILFVISEHDEMCARGLVYERAVLKEELQDPWTLTSTCVFEDGRTHDEQPTPWVPPLLVVLASVTVLCAVVGGWAMWTQRSAARAGGSGDQSH